MIELEVLEWQYEDEMTEESMYNALFPLTRVDGVRMFPKKINIVSISETGELSEEDFAKSNDLVIEAIEYTTCTCGWHTATVKNGKAWCDNCGKPKY